MGAVAADFSWTNEDDFKLRKAAEAGVSLESLARGVVQFSRRFTIQELQDRWHALLYDPVVSAEASARMLEFEHSASALISKSNHLDDIGETISISGKRKAESVRRRFYAMRRRMRDHPLNSLNLSFPNATVNSNGIGNERCYPAADTVVGELVHQNAAAGFPTYEAAGHADINLDVNGTLHPKHQNCVRDNNYVEAYDTGTMVSHISQDDVYLLENNAPVEESDEFQEIYDLLEDVGIESPAFTDQPHFDKLNEYPVAAGDQILPLPPPDCKAAVQNPGVSSTLQQMPAWITEGPCSSTSPTIHIKEEQQSLARMSDFPGDVHSDAAKLGNQMSRHDTITTVTNEDSYLMEISNTLFDFTMEEDLPLIDDDGNMIDKSYIDGLSSLLLDSPNKDATHDANVSTMPVADEFLNNHYAACPGQFSNKGQHQCGRQESKGSEGLLLSSASGMNSKSLDSVTICTLNTEDPEIPSNDDVFLLPLAPFPSPPFVMQMNTFERPPHPTSRSTRDYAVGWKMDCTVPKQIIQKDNRYEPSHFSSPMIGSQLRSEMLGDHRIKQDLPDSDSQNVVCGKSSLRCKDQSQVHREVICRTNHFPASKREVAIKSDHAKQRCNSVSIASEKNTSAYDVLKNCRRLNAIGGNQDMHTLATIHREALHVEVGSIEVTNPVLAVRHSLVDEEALPSQSDDDIPNFSDVEAMILDEDLSPDEQILYLNGVPSHHLPTLKYEHVDIQKRIIRWEQAADAFVKRDMTSQGAFAILQGSDTKYYVKKPEVIIGRATEDVNVDIDLGREGRNCRVSRRQAIIRMDEDGSFHMKNLSKYSIFVNSDELATNQSTKLTSSCLIEIRGMSFLFETNEACMRQYVNRIKNGTNMDNKS